MTFPAASPSAMETFHQFFAAATHEASAAMCRWTSGLIKLSLDEVREVSLDQVCQEFSFGDDRLTMVVLSLEGSLAGEMILTFDEENGRQLAASLLQRPVNHDPEWSELEKSALAETGNILGCAYLNGLTRLIGMELVPSPPYFIQDFGASVFEQAIAPQAMLSDRLLVCRTCFHHEGKAVDWGVYFLPTEPLQRRIEQALQVRPRSGHVGRSRT